jgi:hypothetical protein
MAFGRDEASWLSVRLEAVPFQSDTSTPLLSPEKRKKANMNFTLRKYRWAQVACLILWPILVCAQSSDLKQNLDDCKNGWETCDRSRLSQSESAAVALADHRRNVSNCRDGFQTCDHSQLTQQETIALALANHQQNVSDCKLGMTSCDHSRLSQSEAHEASVAERQRNFDDCKDATSACDRSKLTQSQSGEVELSLRQRNISDCKNGTGSCDRSQLTPSQATEVAAAERERNTYSCENGWDECDHSKLTSREASQIAASEHQRNLTACKESQEACDYSKLTAVEAKGLAEVEHKRQLLRMPARSRLLRCFSTYTGGESLHSAEKQLIPGEVVSELRDLQVRHGASGKKIVAGLCQPTRPAGGSRYASTVRRDSRIRIHLAIDLRDQHKRQSCSQRFYEAGADPNGLQAVEGVPDGLRIAADFLG